MSRPVVGWESSEPVPHGHVFNDYLKARHGRLYFGGLELAQLFLADHNADEGPIFPGLHEALPSPLEVVYLPAIRRKIAFMRQVFADAIAELGYEGAFHYAYASKANAAEEVVRTTLAAGAHHEMSSTIDVDIARLMIERGLLTPERMIICNGFKPANTAYDDNILRLRREHEGVIPVLEDLAELGPFIESGLPFQVGLRQKSYGDNETLEEMEAADSRFGLDIDGIWKAAQYIQAAPNLTLVMYHGMVGSQITDPEDFVGRLAPPMEMYARLRKRYPTLRHFNFGGGMPVGMTLDFEFDYGGFARLLLSKMQETCARYDVPVPDIMGEFGRYTTAEHGCHLFKIILTKENSSELPWYIIDGSIMSSFPDSWALGEHFIVLPLTHLDQPFQQVRLGGMTCDSDDVYPPHNSPAPLYLPVETDELYIGFFSIGAYQEMLGGVRGSKHCVLPESHEIIIDRDDEGEYTFTVIPEQRAEEVLRNLGYRRPSLAAQPAGS